jgi:hypothetical protein
LKITGNLPDNIRGLFLFFGTATDVSNINYTDGYIIDNNEVWILVNYGSYSLDEDFLKSKFDKWGSGKKIFIVVYPFESYEKDLRTGSIRWLGFGKKSNVAEFIVP